MKKDIATLPLDEVYSNYMMQYSLLQNAVAAAGDRIKTTKAALVAKRLNLHDVDFVNSDTDQEESVDELKETALELVVKDFISKYKLDTKHDWFFPQLLAKLSQVKILIGSDGKVDCIATAEHLLNEEGSEELIGAVLLAKAPRNLFFSRDTGFPQYKSSWNTLVPLFLLAQKRYNDVPYTRFFDSSNQPVLGLNRFIHKSLYLALVEGPVFQKMLGMDQEDLLNYRLIFTTYARGKYAGVPQNLASFAKIMHTRGTPFESVNPLTAQIILQTWCAHPNNWKDGGIYSFDHTKPPQPTGSTIRGKAALFTGEVF